MLYHFSEEPDIPIFVPRPVERDPAMEPVVWALEEARSLHYMLPRDCPRVIYWKCANTTPEDEKTFFGHSVANKIIAVENRWLDRIRHVKLYRYTMPEETFRKVGPDDTAGYYVSRETVTPVKVEPAGDVIGNLIQGGIELRFTPSLYPLRDAIIASTVDFSIIRFRSAIP